MSPLDDELHQALTSQAARIDPPADPLGGIERRAQGIRRRRFAASLAGAAVVIAAVAVAVPALVGGHRDSGTAQVATSPTPTSYALDPSQPWDARGTAMPPQLHKLFTQAWGRKHPDTTVADLFSQRYEPSGEWEVAFVATGSGQARYGWATVTESGASFLYDDRLADGTSVLPFLLPGDESRRLVAVAAPGVHDFTYGGTAMAAVADGVAVAPSEADPGLLHVTAPDGTVLYDDRPGATPSPSPSEVPANVLVDWPQRGSAPDPGAVSGVAAAFARAMGREAEVASARYRQLFISSTGKGETFTVGQAWIPGDDQAYSVSYTAPPNGDPQLFIGKPTPTDPVLLAFVVPNLQGMSDLLVVVPQPGTGQVLYSPDASSPFRPITGQDRFDGAVLIDRQLSDTHDRLKLLDGNGDENHPTFEGPVAPLLCGLKECG